MVEKWAFKSSSEVLLEDIDDFLACYSLVTGRTHILDAFPGEIVRLLSHVPRTGLEVGEDFVLRVGVERSATSNHPICQQGQLPSARAQSQEDVVLSDSLD